jgi:DUF4097 and DUF4098 domain-containing protein YvlB
MKKYTAFILGLLVTPLAYAQQFSEKITKEYSFEKKSTDNAVMVANMNGNIKVTGYEGDKIMLEVTRTIYAKTDARLEKGKQEVQLGLLDRADTLIFYVEVGCNTFARKGNFKNGKWGNAGWGYNWDCNNRNCKPEYDYKMDFVLKVPASVHMMVSTINDGDITVENMKGIVSANNINGSIKLTNLVREADVSTINGDVDIEYTTNPVKDCRFYTLNGDINASFQKGLAASLSFESFNGSFFTNIDKMEMLPARVEKSDKGGEGTRYKVHSNRYQVGKGGMAFLDFETFNGNVYLREKVN